jgi:hypothetical protein
MSDTRKEILRLSSQGYCCSQIIVELGLEATPNSTAAVSAAASAGVSLETTYSGKALAALIGDAASGKLDGLDVLFWDTYNSAPMPAPGDIQSLPQVLQDYIAECRRQYPEAR